METSNYRLVREKSNLKQQFSYELTNGRRGCHGHDCMQSVPITTNVVSLNPTRARCTRYNIT